MTMVLVQARYVVAISVAKGTSAQELSSLGCEERSFADLVRSSLSRPLRRATPVHWYPGRQSPLFSALLLFGMQDLASGDTDFPKRCLSRATFLAGVAKKPGSKRFIF